MMPALNRCVEFLQHLILFGLGVAGDGLGQIDPLSRVLRQPLTPNSFDEWAETAELLNMSDEVFLGGEQNRIEHVN